MSGKLDKKITFILLKLYFMELMKDFELSSRESRDFMFLIIYLIQESECFDDLVNNFYKKMPCVVSKFKPIFRLLLNHLYQYKWLCI